MTSAEDAHENQVASDKRQEPPVVPVADAIGHPNAVMVKPSNTPIAQAAVLRPCRLLELACPARSLTRVQYSVVGVEVDSRINCRSRDGSRIRSGGFVEGVEAASASDEGEEPVLSHGMSHL